MAKEIELKVFDVNKKEVEARLRALHAKKTGTYNFKRIIYYINENKSHSVYLRIRTDGKTSTMTLKERFGSGLTQTNEFETQIKNFRETAIMLCKCFKKFVYEETKRTEYMLNGTQITIDKWPMLPLFVEIEGKSEKKVMKMYRLLNIKGKPAGNISATNAYKFYGLNFLDVARRNNKKLSRLLKS